MKSMLRNQAQPEGGPARVTARVEVHGAASARVVGTLVLIGVQRLSDLVNDEDHLLRLDDIEVHPYEAGTPIGLSGQPWALFNKSFIEIIGEVEPEADLGRPLASRSAPPAGDLHVEKQSRRVLIYTPNFAINADLHVAEGVPVEAHLLHLRQGFLPVTNASIVPTAVGAESRALRRRFILVNRQLVHMISAGPDGPAPAGVED
ncbi:MAG: hypothetical protein ACYDAY_05470 [Candidatus Dormibacteria bacterium]